MFNPTKIPSVYQSGLQAPIDSKFYFTNQADLTDVSNDRPLGWFKNMPGINMENGVEYRWKESVEGLISGGYTYPTGVVSFGIDYSERTFNWVAFDLNVNFDASPLADTVTVPEAVGGILAGVSVATLQTKTLNQIIKEILLPAKDAFISLDEYAQATSPQSNSIIEVGANIALTINFTLFTGQIKNGNGSIATTVIGNLTNLTIFNPQSGIIFSDGSPVSNIIAAECIAFAVSLGTNNVTVSSLNAAGPNVTLQNSHLAEQVIAEIETRRNTIVRPNLTITVNGRYKYWYIVSNDNTSINSSSLVRAINDNGFLNEDNTGEFTIPVSAGSSGKEVSFFIPANKTIKVYDEGNLNLDVTRDFVETNLVVNDGGGNPVNYTKYSRDVGGNGYINSTTLKVIIT